MASNWHTSLKQFTLTSVEGFDERKELGRGCYGAVYEVRLHGLPCIAKRLHDILVGRGREEASEYRAEKSCDWSFSRGVYSTERSPSSQRGPVHGSPLWSRRGRHQSHHGVHAHGP